MHSFRTASRLVRALQLRIPTYESAYAPKFPICVVLQGYCTRVIMFKNAPTLTAELLYKHATHTHSTYSRMRQQGAYQYQGERMLAPCCSAHLSEHPRKPPSG